MPPAAANHGGRFRAAPLPPRVIIRSALAPLAHMPAAAAGRPAAAAAADPRLALRSCTCRSPPQKEIRDIERDKASGVTIEVQGNSLQKLIGRLNGAQEGACAAGWHGSGASGCAPRPVCAGRSGMCGAAYLWRPVLTRLLDSCGPAGPRDTPYDGGLFYVDIQAGAPPSWVLATLGAAGRCPCKPHCAAALQRCRSTLPFPTAAHMPALTPAHCACVRSTPGPAAG